MEPTRKLKVGVAGLGIAGGRHVDSLARAANCELVAAADVRPNALRLCPPLTVTQAECDKAVTIIDKVLNRTNGAK